MYGLDMINTSVLGALGCDMNTFLRYFPAAETMYSLLVALAIGLILLGWVWNLFKNYGLGLGVDAEDPVRLTAKAILFIVLAYYADEIVNIALTIGGTPYAWILSSELPSLDFASFNSVLLTIIGVCANGGVALIVLILTLILAWNYIKLLFEAAERYVLLGVLVYTAPVAFAMGASQSTGNIFKSWCRMFGGQIFLLLMNAWCLRLFLTMVGTFISNPLSLYYSVGDRVLVRVLTIDRSDINRISITADIRSVLSDANQSNLDKCVLQGKYAGRVTDVRHGVVFIRLNNGVNAIAHTCYDRRMPGKKDTVSFAVTRLDEERGIAVGIITRIIKQNL